MKKAEFSEEQILVALKQSFGYTAIDDGDAPVGGLIQANDGIFYGTTYQGGANGNQATLGIYAVTASTCTKASFVRS